jgi:hypothetical protein
VRALLGGLSLFALFLAIHVAAFNLWEIERRFRVLAGSFFAVGAVGLGGLLPAPMSLPWQGPWWRWEGWEAGIVYLCLFQGYLQFYFLAERGFSLRILIDVTRSGPEGLNTEEVLGAYSGGRGLDWMLRKRLDHLEKAGFITAQDGRYVNTPFGARVALLSGRLRRLFNITTWG